MAKNPMQRQARNSFLIGIIIGLILTAAVGAILFMQMKKLNEQIKEFNAAKTTAYVLTQDVNSGDVLVAGMFTPTEVLRTSIPSDYVDISTLLDAYSLYTKDGEPITSEYISGEQHLYLNGNKEREVFKEGTDRYYVMNGTEKEYIETSTAPVLAKISTKANTVITPSLITRSYELQTADVRQQEYNVVILPTDLMTGDYVDIRLMLPNGEDFIVVSKKRVTIPQSNGEYLADTIWVDLGEDEILSMSSAIVEAYKIEGSKLYATKYTDAGTQEAATPTYIASREVTSLMDADPNITEEAREGLRARYTNNLQGVRNEHINNAINKYGSDDNVPSGMEESITSTQESRQEYLQGLAGGAATTSGTTSTTTTTNTTTAQ